jgi:hypothetical protein
VGTVVGFLLKTFAAEAAKRCAFLVSEYGFTGPEVERSEDGPPIVSVRYTRDDAVVETRLVLYYMGEDYVITWLELDDDAGTRHRHEVGTNTAHKGHEMRKALDRQSKALHELLDTMGQNNKKEPEPPPER